MCRPARSCPRARRPSGRSASAVPGCATSPAGFVEGFGLLGELGRAVWVFGSARVRPGSPDYARAERIGAELAGAGYAVITGGGPGAMEAANKGAVGANGVSVGLGIELPLE